MSNEIKIELLWNCAKALKGEQQTHKLLKSYYINTCRRLAKNNLQVPKEKFALSQMCPHCGIFWNESEFELKTIPKHHKLLSKEKKLIENYESSTGETLNRSQKNRAKWLMKKQFKRLSIKCQQCKHTSYVNMKNEKINFKAHPLKYEKDAVVLKKCNKYIQGISKQNDDRSVLHAQPKSKLKKGAEKPKTSLVSNKKTKANGGSSNKVISNTQRQNSLLQLATLLKKQTDINTNNSQKNLQTFLK